MAPLKNFYKVYKVLQGIKSSGLKNSYKIFRQDLNENFDELYKTTTSRVKEENFYYETPSKEKYISLYAPSRTVPFLKLFKKVNPSKDLKFIDIGCGKGRVLILAAQLGFKEVYGVELSPDLVKSCNLNIDFVRDQFPETSFHILNEDALLFNLPSDPSLIYLYDPFPREVLHLFLKRIEEHVLKGNRVELVYYNNTEEHAYSFSHDLSYEENIHMVEGNKFYHISFSN